MEALAQLEKERGNPAYLRGGGGSVNPAGIIAPAIVATFFSTLTAIIYCKIMDLRQRSGTK